MLLTQNDPNISKPALSQTIVIGNQTNYLQNWSTETQHNVVRAKRSQTWPTHICKKYMFQLITPRDSTNRVGKHRLRPTHLINKNERYQRHAQENIVPIEHWLANILWKYPKWPATSHNRCDRKRTLLACIRKNKCSNESDQWSNVAQDQTTPTTTKHKTTRTKRNGKLSRVILHLALDNIIVPRVDLTNKYPKLPTTCRRTFKPYRSSTDWWLLGMMDVQ